MLKRTMGSLLFIVLLAGVLAPAAAAGEEEILTLEKAQDLALANSPLLKLSELEYQEKSYAASAASNAYRDLQKDIRSANYGLRDAARWRERLSEDLRTIEDEDKEPLKNIYRQELRLIGETVRVIEDSIDSLISARREQEYRADLAGAEKARARQLLEDRKLTLARNVEAKYYNLLLLDQHYKNLQERLAELVDLQRVEDLRVSLGLSTPFNRAAIGAEAENMGQLIREYSTLRRLARQEFNALLGRDLDAPLHLSEDIEIKTEPVPHPGTSSRYVDNSSTRRILREQIKVQEERLRNLAEEHSKGDPEYHQVQKNLERLQLEYEQAADSLRTAITAAYNRVREARANLRSREAQHKLAQEQLRIARLQHEAGLVTNQEVRAKENEAREAETLYRQAAYDLNLAVTDYNLALEGIDMAPLPTS
ncbi:MAG TPA: TolC family protein [Firmicutes bacterium]|nr:TolC family protein [Bacillota bacterium]